MSGKTAKGMSDDDLGAHRDEAAAVLRRFNLEVARRRCVESLAAEVKSYVCPITLAVMEHPVMARDGYSYERSALEQYIAGRPNFLSPMTGLEIPSEPLMTNNGLRSDIQNRLEEMARAEVDGAAAGARQRRRLDD